MQKKLYFLNEEEKNRILNLHESRTKKQYLINEISPVIGLVQSYFTEPKDIEGKLFFNRQERAKKLDEVCTKKNLGAQENEKSKVFITWFNNQNSQNKSAYEKNNAWEKLPNILSKFNTTDEFCRLHSDIRDNQLVTTDAKKRLGKTTGIAGWLYQNISYQDSWIRYFEEPLKNVLKSAGMETLDSAQSTIQADDETDKDWTDTKFSCALNLSSINPTTIKGNNDKWVKRTTSSGTIEYFSNTGLFFTKYQNGDVLPSGKDEFFTFTCVDGKPLSNRTIKTVSKSETPNSQVGSTDYSVGPGVVQQKLKSQIPDLLKKANISGSEINQDTINQLYKLLNK
jgi:hypothetical protein